MQHRFTEGTVECAYTQAFIDTVSQCRATDAQRRSITEHHLIRTENKRRELHPKEIMRQPGIVGRSQWTPALRVSPSFHHMRSAGFLLLHQRSGRISSLAINRFINNSFFLSF